MCCWQVLSPGPMAANLIRSRATTRFKCSYPFHCVRKRLNPRGRCSLRVLTGFPFAHSRDHVPRRTTVAKWNITQDPAPSTPTTKQNKRRTKRRYLITWGTIQPHHHPTMHPSGHHMTPEAQPVLSVTKSPPSRGLHHDFQPPVAGL